MRDRLAALLDRPGLVAEMALEALPGLLLVAAEERERIGAVERALLARLTGEGVPCAPEAPARSRARWLRVHQVVAEYGVSAATVYDWVYHRRVTTKKLGGAKGAPVLLYRPDIEKRARLRRPLAKSLDSTVIN